MYLRSLNLEEFRSYRRLGLSFDPRGLRLAGANASGKSSLLEAIVMLATTRSVRSSAERQLINWDSGTDLGFPPFARVSGEIVRAEGPTTVEITLETDPARPTYVRKQIKLRGRPVRAMDAVGTLRAVLFSPDDVALVSGPPSERRRYLDLTISQVDAGYLRSLARYQRVLEQRNSLLKSFARDGVSPTSAAASAQLGFWNDELIAFGSAIIAHRWRTVQRLSTLAAERFAWLTSTGPLGVAYRPSVDLSAVLASSEPKADSALQAIVVREFVAGLDAVRADEIRRGMSLLGPHRDDLDWSLAGTGLAIYGSRGQQRLAVVALKLAEAHLMDEVGGEPPVVLLDDVLSELDVVHQDYLTATVAKLGGQVVITATDERLLARTELAELPSGRVEHGIMEMEPAVYKA